MWIFPGESLKRRSDDLLNQAHLSYGAGTPSKLRNSNHVEIRRGGRQDSDLGESGFGGGVRKIDPLGEVELQTCLKPVAGGTIRFGHAGLGTVCDDEI